MIAGHVVRVALVCGALAGCDDAQRWPPAPADVRFGEDECSHCRMIVGDERFAAQLVERGGGVRRYDDLGCLIADRPGADPQGVFVAAFDGGGWIRGDRATVARSPALRSPMGFGLAAFSSAAGAEAEAHRHTEATVIQVAALLRGDVHIRPPGSPGSTTPVPKGETSP